MTRASIYLRVLAATAALLLAAAACTDDHRGELVSADSEEESPTVGDPWGPLAVVEAPGGGDLALIAGTLKIDDNCVLLDEGGELVLLVWPQARTAWDSQDMAVVFTSLAGKRMVFQNGDRATFAGGGSSVDEDGNTVDDFLESVAWISEPNRDCVVDVRWFVSDVLTDNDT